MSCPSKCCRLSLLRTLVVVLLAMSGCEKNALPKDVGTSATVGLPEGQPPVLTKTLADRLRPGLSQVEALTILQDAALETPSAKSSVEAAVVQGKLNSIRYDLTITQGLRKLVLVFKDGKLVDKTQEGME
jgi:hypothetical protein